MAVVALLMGRISSWHTWLRGTAATAVSLLVGEALSLTVLTGVAHWVGCCGRCFGGTHGFGCLSQGGSSGKCWGGVSSAL